MTAASVVRRVDPRQKDTPASEKSATWCFLSNLDAFNRAPFGDQGNAPDVGDPATPFLDRVAPLLFDGGTPLADWGGALAGVLLIVLSVPRGTVRNHYGRWNRVIV